jgi:hypothetical protein
MYALRPPAQSTPADSLDTGLQAHGAGFGGGGATMNFRGDYDSGVGYLTGDVVTFKGSAYVAGDATKNAPPDDPWALLAEAGGQGADGATGPAGPPGPPGAQGAKGDTGDVGPAGTAFGTGWQMVEVSLGVPSGGAMYGATATCPSTKAIVTGGWYQSGGSTGLTVVESLVRSSGGPNFSPLGGTYRARLVNNTGTGTSVQVYAICVTP